VLPSMSLGEGGVWERRAGEGAGRGGRLGWSCLSLMMKWKEEDGDEVLTLRFASANRRCPVLMMM
jgi:hypothetical protein